MVWYGVVWCGMVWYGVVWYGVVWYGVVCFFYALVFGSNKVFHAVTNKNTTIFFLCTHAAAFMMCLLFGVYNGTCFTPESLLMLYILANYSV